MFDLMIDIGPKFLSAIPQAHAHDLKVKVTDFEILQIKYYVKVFKSSYFPNCKMDLVHIWYDDRYRSKVSFSNTPADAHDLKVKITDFWNFTNKVLR